MHENFLSGKIIGCCIAIHKSLGPGLLESVYETALVHELTQVNLRCDRQKEIVACQPEFQIIKKLAKIDYTSICQDSFQIN